MRSTIKSIMREWSSEGQEERDTCYQPIIQEVTDYFQSLGKEAYNPQTQERISVLHPGCGLGRLAFEFAA